MSMIRSHVGATLARPQELTDVTRKLREWHGRSASTCSTNFEACVGRPAGRRHTRG
jgi:hypothetical protein